MSTFLASPKSIIVSATTTTPDLFALDNSGKNRNVALLSRSGSISGGKISFAFPQYRIIYKSSLDRQYLWREQLAFTIHEFSAVAFPSIYLQYCANIHSILMAAPSCDLFCRLPMFLYKEALVEVNSLFLE